MSNTCSTCKYLNFASDEPPCKDCVMYEHHSEGMPIAPPTRGEQPAYPPGATKMIQKAVDNACDAAGAAGVKRITEQFAAGDGCASPIGVWVNHRAASIDELRADIKATLPPPNAADILDKMAATYRERNAIYGSNYKMVAPLVKVLFPDGVPSELVATHKWHLFELMLVKLSRLAISNIEHLDSIHDCGVYAAMVEACMEEERQQ